MEIQQFCTSNYPPGFRFHPSDEELIVHYLLNKISSSPLPADVVAEIELYKYNPWELPNKSLFGEDEWYFFTPRDRKYPNGQRPSRTAGSGYWKATGTDKAILSGSGSRSIGVKKALVFYKGRPPKGTKTEWIMTEYRLLDTLTRSSRSKGSKRLDDWVLCRIRQKGNMSKNKWADNESPSPSPSSSSAVDFFPKIEELPSADIKSNVTEITTDYLMKDCHLLASILACQDLPPIENISNVTTFPVRNNNPGSWFNYDHTYNNKYDNLVGLNKMAISEMNGSSQVVIPGNMMMTTSVMNFCNQNVQGQGNIFNVPIQSDAIMNLLLWRKDF